MPDPEHTKALAYELAHRSLAQVITETGVFILIALTALVGNSCVLYVFYKSPRLRSVTSYYIITLAISDVIVALTMMPITTTSCAYGRDVIYHPLGQAVGFVGYSLIYGSVQTTSLIAINRFFCVVKPSLYRTYFKPKPALLMIIGIWIFSISFVALFYFSEIGTFEYGPSSFGYILVFRDRTLERVFAAFTQILFAGVPLSLTTICYWKVYKLVQTHNATVSPTLNAGPANRCSLTKEEVHITKSVLALVCGFVICWIPCSTVFNLMSFFNLPRRVEMIVMYTAYASSAVNPFIFNIFNKPFRKQFVQLFRPAHPRVEATTSNEMLEKT